MNTEYLPENKTTNVILHPSDYTADELTEDGLPTVESQLRRLDERDRNITIQDKYRNLAMRVKCLSLDMMGLSPMTNTYNLSNKQREQLQNNMRTYEDKDLETIVEEFNTMMNEKLFVSTMDPSKLPMYHI